MPTYEYECKDCKHNFETFQSIKDEPLSVCPVCGGTVKRLLSGGAGVIFKGQGFYVTDKGKSAQSKVKDESGKSGAAAAAAQTTTQTADKKGGNACASCPKAADSGCAALKNAS